MSYVDAAVIAVLLVIYTIASYVERLYMEMGRFLAREYQENIDAWEQDIEPRMGLKRGLLQLCAVLLVQLSFAALLVLIEWPAVLHVLVAPSELAGELAQTALTVVLLIVIFNQFLPFVLFSRTKGMWLRRWRYVLIAFLYLVVPVALVLQFFISIASLAEVPAEARGEDEAEAVEALIEAGEEEGILDESDRELVRSALEFGDKVAREVMTPRPQIVAVPGGTTLEQFTEMLQVRPLSRVPVYEGSLDQITGIVFSHDLLGISDEDAKTRTVASLQRPASFVPETKRVNELLREMQMEKQHMRIVIDEYGGVAGLVTIEDLLEEIVGAISDEHEETDEMAQVTREADGACVVPGSLELDELKELMHEEIEIPEDTDATTVAGLVSELAGRIPMAGEVIERHGLRFEILASTDRRIERLRVSRIPEVAA
jgi:CBS domain containing-hemolysin-like protein